MARRERRACPKRPVRSEQRCQTAQGALALRVAPLFRLSGVARRLQTASGMRPLSRLGETENRQQRGMAEYFNRLLGACDRRGGLRGNGASRLSRGPVRRYPRSSARYESQLFGSCATIETMAANFPMPTCQTCKSVTTESPSLSTARRISSGKSDDGGVRSSRIPLVSRNSV